MRLSRVGIIVTLALSLLCVSLTANARPGGEGPYRLVGAKRPRPCLA